MAVAYERLPNIEEPGSIAVELQQLSTSNEGELGDSSPAPIATSGTGSNDSTAPAAVDGFFVNVLRLNAEAKQVQCKPTDTVAHVVETALGKEQIEGKNVRAVANGFLVDNSATLESCRIQSGNYLHVVVSEAVRPASQNPTEPSAAAVAPGEDAHIHVGEEELYQVDPEQMRLWEESRRDARLGTNYTLMFGVVVGLILGPLGLLLFFMRGSTRKLKIGLCIGVVLQVVGNVLLKKLADSGSGDSGNSGGGGGGGSGNG